ncbi:TRAP-type mannitol/chloroaromatic compound transport system, substrate-binding protein [Tistlia consotensis]|uniref:TRAP-type mannitol/chloroaromatic compound transport system, substrate-binding protein n=1 Tax=Tistlia consotensis USBA 355 TaxID=560819 RepID=A0A1Y6C753_9PROT|nr:TRAP transporter substrate-binding protein [Tistlia consotensis]SMF48682.1 TRAP-type mannitol/chloroaromatic compound transport system, substrate-binding protein [Tistlia consotensis USBA 355]SNR80894.1 TRAP-type mannitol/chloroaromatic compound transport system, substrate-binding protein [Tistlia consotensis]
MNRRGFLRSAGVAGTGAVAAAVSSFPKPAISAGKIEWRMEMTWAKNSPLLSTGPQVFADFVSKASGGRLTVKVYAAGEIAPPFGVMDAVADGALDVGHGYPPFWAGKLPAMTMLCPVPFGLTTQEQNAWFEYGGGLALADKVYSQLGVKFFPSGNTSVQGAAWTNKLLDSMAAFNGLKIRIGGLGAKVIQAVGGTPVQLPLGQVPQALQTGTLDGADFVGPFNDVAFGLHKVAKYYYWPGIFEPCGVLDCFINLNSWNKLDDDLKEIVRGGNYVANQVVISEFVAKNAEGLKTIEASDAEIKIFPEEVLKGLGAATKDVLATAASADALSKEIYDSIMAFRKTVMPYTKISEFDFMRARMLAPDFA